MSNISEKLLLMPYKLRNFYIHRLSIYNLFNIPLDSFFLSDLIKHERFYIIANKRDYLGKLYSINYLVYTKSILNKIDHNNLNDNNLLLLKSNNIDFYTFDMMDIIDFYLNFHKNSLSIQSLYMLDPLSKDKLDRLN